MNEGTRFPCRLVVVCLLILATSWSVAHAAELAPGVDARWRQSLDAVPGASLEATPPLLFSLPDGLPADHASVLKVEIRANDKPVVRQEIELPAGLADGGVVELVAEPVNQRELLEKLEAANPGSVWIDLSLDGQLLEEISLSNLEQETATLTPPADLPVGTPRRLDVLVGTRPNRLATKSYEDGRDPECVQHCDDERYDCYVNRCDPRGSCEYCETYYDDCVLSCPVCPTTKDTSTTTILGISYYNQYGCFLGFFAGTGAVHQLAYRTLRLRVWRTVTQCDGSSTTTLITDTTYSEICWQELPPPNNYCSPWGPPYGYPICFPY